MIWLDMLSAPVAPNGAWRSWTGQDGQVGGWTTTYAPPGGSSLTLATVRNAGHLVPGTQASRALYMFTHFLAGADL
jgi:serine carboxypeptidase-like clade 2